MENELCIIGKSFNIPCNQTYLNIPFGFAQWHTLKNSEKDEIILKTKICGITLEFENNSRICAHHKTELTFPSSKGKRATTLCVDPFQKHSGGVKAEVLKATTYFKFLSRNKRKVLPGQHVCVNCINSLKKAIEFETLENEDEEWEPPDQQRFTKINQVCSILGLQEFLVTKLSTERIAKKAEKKLQEMFEALVSEFIKDNIQLPASFTEQPFQKARDHDSFFINMKAKFKESKYNEKIQLMTMLPQTSTMWTIDYTSKYFQCPRYAVVKSRKLRDTSGFLAVPPPCKPKKFVEPSVVQAVKGFYLREDNVWQSPNVRDTKKIKLDTGKVEIRKVFLVHPLKELYDIFRKENEGQNVKLGFSTFAKLRPKECELYATTCTQNVCVCSIHGNIELMLSGIGEGRDLKHRLIESLVCDRRNFECMIRVCEICCKTSKCEKYEDFCNILGELICEDRFESGIKFAIWKSDKTKRISLVETTVSVPNYIEALYSKFYDFLPHEYTTKIQSQSFQAQKKDHVESTALVIGDFSENYTCVVQNEVQSAYFSKTQVTIHPFVAYVKLNGKEHVISSAVISDCLKHNTVTFYSFQTCFLKYLSSQFPHINHIEYWSDGCAAQYKNYKNFLNISFHEKDFGITAGWNFFATSHGKTGSDGVGATIKYRTRNKSLRCTSKEFIDSAIKVYNFCNAQNWEIHPLFVSSHEVNQLAATMDLNTRFALMRTLPQTQKCHRIEIKEGTIRLYRTSMNPAPFYEVRLQIPPLCPSDNINMETEVTHTETSDHLDSNGFPFIVLVDDSDLNIGSFAAINRKGLLFIAKIAEAPNSEVGTVKVQFLRAAGCRQTFTLEDFNIDATNILTADVLGLIHPIAAGTTKRSAGQLKLMGEEIEVVNDELKKRLSMRTLLQ